MVEVVVVSLVAVVVAVMRCNLILQCNDTQISTTTTTTTITTTTKTYHIIMDLYGRKNYTFPDFQILV